MPSVNPPRARGVDRIIELFRQLHIARKPMTMRELIASTDAPRSSIYELVGILADADWLEIQPDGNVFFGRAMHYYGADYAMQNDLLRRAHQLMMELVSRLSETVQLCIMDGNKYTVVLSESGSRPFKITSDIGVKVPIPWTASGRLLLGHLSSADILALIPPEDFLLADGRTIDQTAFLADVKRASQQGYSMTEGLSDNFTCCMAAPIYSRGGQAIAAFCFMVSRDTDNTRRQMLLQELIASARKLSELS
ncbi:IclR family transcriptional regulator [Martelella alba]|uniref:IclR family transcriptional regulator n=1 Tax=Martelella alba TaxID=2590451 RepID=A0ABY2SND4_9HYPH|nr:IclR family transcriptional regulator [Martelella alba]TKI06580.1 IclR family transcriptional regulator [Martelella alba]